MEMYPIEIHLGKKLELTIQCCVYVKTIVFLETSGL